MSVWGAETNSSSSNVLTTTYDVINNISDVMNTTAGAFNNTHGQLLTAARVLSPTFKAIVLITYAVGIAGNLLALFILQKERRVRYRNTRHTLMLRCLAGNDLVGLVGMLVQILLLPYSTNNRIGCGFRVVWRGFGVSSGCVALVMAIERWLALTHPLKYHKRVTYNGLLKAILTCWSAVLVVTCMPFFGFGLYFDAESSRCRRYRDAETPVDVAYAYVFFAFGLMLSMGIVWANSAVSRYLCRPSASSDVGRRICRTNSRTSNQRIVRVECLSTATPDELAFARLMVALSITFLMCWLPNLIAIPLAQWRPPSAALKKFFDIADILMAIHFTLDPYVYVILHHYFPCLRITFDAIQRYCCWRSKTDTASEESSCLAS